MLLVGVILFCRGERTELWARKEPMRIPIDLCWKAVLESRQHLLSRPDAVGFDQMEAAREK